jgi:hypothetical protein
VGDLHPFWTQLVCGGEVRQSFFLERVLPIHKLGSDSDPPLVLTHDLDHALRVACNILVLYITVIRVVHHSEIAGHVVLVSVILGTSLLS